MWGELSGCYIVATVFYLEVGGGGSFIGANDPLDPLYFRFLSPSPRLALVLARGREIHDPPRSSSPRLDVKASRLSTRLWGKGLLSERGFSRVGKDCVRSPIDTLPVYASRGDDEESCPTLPRLCTRSRSTWEYNHETHDLFFFFFFYRGIIRWGVIVEIYRIIVIKELKIIFGKLYSMIIRRGFFLKKLLLSSKKGIFKEFFFGKIIIKL